VRELIEPRLEAGCPCSRNTIPTVGWCRFDYKVFAMTMDRSLRIRRALVKVRSVLTRAERIKRLQELERWSEEVSPLGLPKVRVQKISMKKKKKKKEEDTAQQDK